MSSGVAMDSVEVTVKIIILVNLFLQYCHYELYLCFVSEIGVEAVWTSLPIVEKLWVQQIVYITVYNVLIQLIYEILLCWQITSFWMFTILIKQHLENSNYQKNNQCVWFNLTYWIYNEIILVEKWYWLMYQNDCASTLYGFLLIITVCFIWFITIHVLYAPVVCNHGKLGPCPRPWRGIGAAHRTTANLPV